MKKLNVNFILDGSMSLDVDVIQDSTKSEYSNKIAIKRAILKRLSAMTDAECDNLVVIKSTKELKEKRYEVWGMREVDCTKYVYAYSEEEARDKAEDLFCSAYIDEGEFDDVTFSYGEIKSVEESES